ncbi:hypothetical protein DFH09DRAFT_1355791 [Mycena vulgaris]|nr:hypothetical protein DFH09DRAFT_1355791 [Mycena vulgaris]
MQGAPQAAAFAYDARAFAYCPQRMVATDIQHPHLIAAEQRDNASEYYPHTHFAATEAQAITDHTNEFTVARWNDGFAYNPHSIAVAAPRERLDVQSARLQYGHECAAEERLHLLPPAFAGADALRPDSLRPDPIVDADPHDNGFAATAASRTTRMPLHAQPCHLRPIAAAEQHDTGCAHSPNLDVTADALAAYGPTPPSNTQYNGGFAYTLDVFADHSGFAVVRAVGARRTRRRERTARRWIIRACLSVTHITRVPSPAMRMWTGRASSRAQQ